MKESPYQKIIRKLEDIIPCDLLQFLPKKWEKLGNVLIIRLPGDLLSFEKEIGRIYASELGCKSVLVDIGGISGVFRKPEIRHIFGDKNTETLHIENGVKFHLDPQKVMFSSGNMDERKRMAGIGNCGETVVDLFAGIGYFSIPMAVHSKPSKIYSCEINPTAFSFLKKNIVSNHVTDIVEPIFGDNKKTAPKDIADRVLMGYFNETELFLPTAIQSLKNNQGIIHYHDTFPDKGVPDIPLNIIKEASDSFNRKVKLLNVCHVKSYAPGVSHYVIDVKIVK